MTPLHVQFTRHLFDLGLILNKGKSTLKPAQTIEFTGAMLDCMSLKAFLMIERLQVICHPSMPPASPFSYNLHMPEIARVYDSMHFHSSAREIASSSFSSLVEISLSPELSGDGQLRKDSTKDPGLPRVVEKSDQRLPGCSLCPPFSNQDYSYCCIQSGLGSTSRDIKSSGFGDQAGSFSSYQHSGALSHLK